MLNLLLSLKQWLAPMLEPFCFITAWSLVAIVLWSFWTMTRDGLVTVKRLHRIPCANCQYFTGNYQLKCAVHPDVALTEGAIDCMDYQGFRST